MFLGKIRPLSPAHSFKLQSGFYFDAVASSFPRGLGGCVCFPVDLDIFVSVPRSICTRPFAIVLALICTFLHQSKFTCSEGGEASFSQRFDRYTVPCCYFCATVFWGGVMHLQACSQRQERQDVFKYQRSGLFFFYYVRVQLYSNQVIFINR